MQTTHEQAVARAVATATPELMQALSKTMNRMNAGFHPKWFLDAVVQKPWGVYDLHDAYVFANLNAMDAAGSLQHVAVEVGAGPFRDLEESRNATVLANAPDLDVGVDCQHGGGADDDGWVRFTPAFVSNPTVEPGIRKWLSSHPGLPLEIGYTKASKTFMHMARFRGVARWPYGHTRLFLLMLSDEELWRPGL